MTTEKRGREEEMTAKEILLIGALDTKGDEYRFVADRLREGGLGVLVADTGVLGDPQGLTPDISSESIAREAGTSLEELRASGDRGTAMAAMAEGAARTASRLHEQGRIAGILGMGGTGGTSVISAAMKELPIGFPKVLVSTAAAGDTRPIVGTRDVILIPSVVDVAGVNRISRLVYAEAAAAMVGLVNAPETDQEGDRPIVAISMFGNTTPCAEACRASLEDRGYEVLVFHATGTGGRVMEDLVREGLVAGVLDITTTEWADELCGGVFNAGPERLDSPGVAGIPHLVVPGCLDMVNFGPRESVPDKYSDRQFHVWNPTVTLMRTNVEENRELGEIIAAKLNRATSPRAVLVPLGGVSMLDSEGGEFWSPEADSALYEALRSNLDDEIQFEEVDANINDPAFSDRATALFLEMMERSGQ